jgi:hypothetical protein
MKANEKLLPLLMKRKFDGGINNGSTPGNQSPNALEVTEKPAEVLSARHGNRRQLMIESLQNEYM